MIPRVQSCYCCGGPLASAAVEQRRYRRLRWGPQIGGLGEYRKLRCDCGHTGTYLWNVVMPTLHTRQVA